MSKYLAFSHVPSRLVDSPRRREIVLPHYVYSGVLQVSFLPLRTLFFFLPVAPWEPVEEKFGYQVLTAPSTLSWRRCLNRGIILIG